MLDFDVVTWSAGIVVMAAVLTPLWVKKRSFPYVLFFAVFWVYVLVVIKQTLFAIPLSGPMVEELRNAGHFMSSVNLIPGHFGRGGLDMRGIINNVLLALPFGFGLNFLARVKLSRLLWIALGFGATVEGLQLVISLGLGFAYRVIDINDLLLNAVGVALGYALFYGFARLFLMLQSDKRDEAGAFAGFLYEVTSRTSHRRTDASEMGVICGE
jgi:glycopeptide antibiotics resistance protein